MPLAPPLFTVATITYNSCKWVDQAIESVLASSFTDFEFLISDDCSTDDTWSIIQRYNDPRIRAWRNDTNVGEYPNRNKVLYEAKGTYILFVDGDDMLYAQTLRNLSEYLAAWPQAVSIWGVWSHQMQFCFFPVLLQPLEIMRWIYGANLPIAIMGFGETLFKTESLKSIGGFSNAFISGDTYVKKKLALSGPILLVPVGFMFWRKTKGQATHKLTQNYNGYINNVLIDRDIIAQPFFKQYSDELELFIHNCKVRDVKLLLRNTLLKGNIKLWFRFMREFGFALADLKYAFKKADFSYLKKIEQQIYKGDKRE